MKLPVKIKGKVKVGKRKGHTVGMPTANISYDFSKNDMEYGVYASYVYVDDKRYKSVTNVGLRPSVDNSDIPTIETHILDFNEDIYEKEIELELVSYIRGIQKFNGLEEVKKQVDKDIQEASSVL
ncbi:MAG: riboflavin kinase [Lachnospiraceae bacterium]|nr:riboflavin kinase [Lachnospiraceae bacterium]